MPQIKKPAKKPKAVKAKKTIKKPTSQARRQTKRPQSQVKLKNPVAYFGCMRSCCQKGIKPKKITEVARECKHNALAINAKMSAAKTQAAKKIKVGYETMGKGLAEFIEASK